MITRDNAVASLASSVGNGPLGRVGRSHVKDNAVGSQVIERFAVEKRKQHVFRGGFDLEVEGELCVDKYAIKK